MACASSDDDGKVELQSKLSDVKDLPCVSCETHSQIQTKTQRRSQNKLQLQEEDDKLSDESDMGQAINYDNFSLPKGIDVVKYIFQKELWPKEGKHILAQYDDKTVIVYQAFKPSIAKYAVENQRFGGPEFSYERMSWIKTNFLWMTYRCGWASKKNQERVLAVKLSRYGFEIILANAYTVSLQKECNLQTKDIGVRLQWDPDHSPNYAKLNRKAIQLGLKGEILKKYGTEWIHSITDITDFVKSQKKILEREGQKELMTPRERVYQVQNYSTTSRINLDVYDVSNQPVFTQRRELVVFHLDENISDKLLAETFKQYGPLEDVRILLNKQTGFVSFKNTEDASQARASLNGTFIAGKKIKVDYASQRNADGGFKDSVSTGATNCQDLQIKTTAKQEPTPSRKVWISGLSPKVEITHLKEVFSNYGPLEGAHIIHDKLTGTSTGLALIEFKTKEDAIEAKEHLDGGQIDGQEVKVQFTKPQSIASGAGNNKPRSSKDWTCQNGDCGNVNFSARKRCSRCNKPRFDMVSGNNGTSYRQKETCGQVLMDGCDAKIDGAPVIGDVGKTEGRCNDQGDESRTEFSVPDDLHIPSGMLTPETADEHSLIEKTAKFVAANGIGMEIQIKDKQGSNPKFRFLNLHDPLNFYYNHMVKMIKAGKYTPS